METTGALQELAPQPSPRLLAGVGVEGCIAFVIGLMMLRGNSTAVALGVSFLLLGVGIPAGYWLWLTNTRLLIGRGVVGYQDLFGRRRLWQPSDIEHVVEVNILYPGRGGGTPRPCLLLVGAGGMTLQKVRTAQWSGAAIEAFESATGREREFMGTSMAINVAKAFPGSVGRMYAHPGWSIVVGVVAAIGTVLALEVFAHR